MEKFQPFHEAIRSRRDEPGAFYYPDPWWDKEIAVVTGDLQAAMEFIDTECSDEELYWLGEVFDDIMDKTRSSDFLACLRRRVQRVENPEWKTELQENIRDAAEYLDESSVSQAHGNEDGDI